MLIIAILGFGMLVGWLAQIVLGMGTRPNAQSLIAGIGGSFVGGLLFSLIAHEGFGLRPSGLIGSFVGALIVLLVWNVVTRMQASGDAKASAADKRAARSGNPAKKGR